MSRPGGRLGAALPVLIGAVLLAGCTSSSSDPKTSAPPASGTTGGASPSATQSAAPPKLTKVWTSSGVHPVSPVKIAGSTALVYGDAAKQLYLYGLDAATGKVKWKQKASTASETPGVAVHVTTLGSRVAYYDAYRAKDGSAARVVVADAATGRTVSHSDVFFWASDPTPCSTANTTLCITAYGPPDGAASEYRVNVSTGKMSKVSGRNTGFRELGDQLFDPLQRDPEYVSHRVGDKAVWKQPLADLFGSDTSTDDGWDFLKYGTAAYGGTLYTGLDHDSKSRTVTLNLTNQLVSAGFRPSDGKLLWRTRGVSVDCNFTLSQPFTDTPLPFRCKYLGSITYKYGPVGSTKPAQVTTSGLDVVLEGFDPATGKATWQVQLGDSKALADGSDVSILRSDQQVVIHPRQGDVVVDLRSGKTQPVAASDVFWCQSSPSFTAAPKPANADKHPETRSATIVGICDAKGKATTTLPSTIPASLAAKGGGLQLVSTAGGVVAYRSS